MEIKIGCDPELFVQDGPRYISAFGILPGTKQEPYKVERGAVQVDGFAFEFNIDPATNALMFERNISTVLKQMEEMLAKVDRGLKLAFVPFAKFDKDYFKAQPEEAKILGCDPDYNFLGDQMNPPEDLQNSPFRTASGHVHIGWTEGMKPHGVRHFEECTRISKSFHGEKEFFKPRTLLEKKRYNYYGRLGAFRPKSYGVELRAPSNRWVASKESRRSMFFNIRNKMDILAQIG